MLLLGSTREQASIEFGAQQVILVRSQEAKNGLEEDLRRGALVCTVCTLASPLPYRAAIFTPLLPLVTLVEPGGLTRQLARCLSAAQVFESKGLEFEDVLLFNFFKDRY